MGSPHDPATICSGTFADSYLTTFDNEPLDPTDTLIEYISGFDPGQDQFVEKLYTTTGTEFLSVCF